MSIGTKFINTIVLFCSLIVPPDSMASTSPIDKILTKASSQGIDTSTYIVVDMTLPSNQPRLFLYKDGKLVLKTYTSHGIGSGNGIWATYFSNTRNSHATSIGVYITDKRPYMGKYGRSIRLIGVDPGYNDNALSRAIVLHPATYVSQIQQRAGHSWGCLTLDPIVSNTIIKAIQGGKLVIVYAETSDWLTKSRWLQ